MNLEQFGEELKKIRVEEEISLSDISAETRINLKFLEAIERGQFQILPQTYVRAFLREYALMLNLDPDDIVMRYDSARQALPPRKSDLAPSSSSVIPDIQSTKTLKERIFSLSLLQRNIAVGIFIVTAIALVIMLANMNKGLEPEKSVTEVPFDRVIRESEAASIPTSPATADYSPTVLSPQEDSLRLEMTTTDSVWISLLIDGKKGEEYLFSPNRKKVWVANERFIITMGNAGGATFRLNGIDIGPLGKRGAVVRNAVITEANLKN